MKTTTPSPCQRQSEQQFGPSQGPSNALQIKSASSRPGKRVSGAGAKLLFRTEERHAPLMQQKKSG